MRRFLLKKAVVLGLMVFLTVCFTFASVFPSADVLASWWFLLIFLFFVLSLVFSCFDQYRIVQAKIHAVPAPGAGWQQISVQSELFVDALKKEGYRELARNEVCVRYGKGRLGHWGGFILHVGITVTVLFSLLYVLTEHRVIVRVVQGKWIDTSRQDKAERKGLFGAQTHLPKTLFVQRIEPAFWKDGRLKSLFSEIVLVDKTNRRENRLVGISAKSSYAGMVIYQQNSFGNVFTVEFSEGGKIFSMPLALPLPLKAGGASYRDFEIADGRYKLKTKYVADIMGREIMPKNPLLTLRLYEGDRLIGENALMMNGMGQLGPYSVSLVDARWWTDILFDGSHGISGIFLGFFLLLIGGGLGYFAVPRELLLCRESGIYTFSWRAAKFRDFYRDEEERIMSYSRLDHE